jgi:hypothetical protein
MERDDKPSRKRRRKEEEPADVESIVLDRHAPMRSIDSGNQFSALAAFRNRSTPSSRPRDSATLKHLTEPQSDDNLSEMDNLESSARSDDDMEYGEAGSRSPGIRKTGTQPGISSRTRVSSFRPSQSNAILVDSQAVDGRSYALLGISDGEQFVFEGAAAVGCIRGRCNVFGFDMVAAEEVSIWLVSEGGGSFPVAGVMMHPVFSMRTHGLLSLAAGSSGGLEPVKTADKQKRPVSAPSPEKQTGDLISVLRANRRRLAGFANVVIVADIASTDFSGISDEVIDARDIFPTTENADQATEIPLVPGCMYVESVDSSGPRFVASLEPDWAGCLDSLVAHSAGSDEPMVIAVVGPKNAGKSTFARLLCNRLLNVPYGRVIFLDSDIGQCEFTPHGAVSLKAVTSPLLGPPYSHSSQPTRSMFLGATSPEKDPDHYLGTLRALIDTHRKMAASQTDSKPSALVVNTHGWVRGMGFDMLSYFLEYLRPTHIVELRHPDNEARNCSGDLRLFAETLSNAESSIHLAQLQAAEASFG